MNIKIIKSNRTKGILCLMISGLGFAFMSMFIKLSGDLPQFQKVFFRNFIAVFFAGWIVYKAKGSYFGKKENLVDLVGRSAFGMLGMIFNFYAIDHIFIADASMLNKLCPFWVVLFCAIMLKEKIKPVQIVALISVFIGALFIIKPSFDVKVFPYLIGFLSSIFAAMAYTLIRKLRGREEPYTIVFFFSFFSTIVSAIPMLLFYEPMSLFQLGALLMSGVAATVGQFGITNAYKFAPAKEISVFDYSNIVFTAILGIITFGEIPDKMSLMGYFIVFGTAFFVFKYNQKLDDNVEKN